jgi:opacity protein-like surface antigen
MRIRLAAVLATLGALAASTVEAATGDQIGAAIRVVNSVTGEINNTPRPLTSGDGVRQDETIAAATNALAELRLDDDSKLAVGPGARLVLDKFVYNPNAKGSINLSLITGAFRFITGLARKQDYLIKTPTAVISVRGTIFDVYVAPDGTTYVLLHEGSITACNTSGQCAQLNNPCGVVRISGSATPTALRGFNQISQIGRPNFATAFPFVTTPPSIDPTPRFTRTAVEAGQCEPAPKGPQQTQRADAPPQQPYNPPSRQAPLTPSVPMTPPPVVVTETQGPPPSRTPWGGLYVGVVAGAVWQTSNPYLDCSDFTPGTTVCSTETSFSIPARAYGLNDTGFTGGGQIGYNLALGNFVAGVEADISYTDISATSRFDQVFTFPCCVIVRGSSTQQDLKSLSTLRARLGYSIENVLLYATGGLAVGQVDYAFQLNWPDIGGFAGDQMSKLAVGYTLGGGLEIALGSWSVKTEYLLFDLGQENLNAQFTRAGSREPFVFRPEFETQGHIVRVGTSYHFN